MSPAANSQAAAGSMNIRLTGGHDFDPILGVPNAYMCRLCGQRTTHHVLVSFLIPPCPITVALGTTPTQPPPGPPPTPGPPPSPAPWFIIDEAEPFSLEDIDLAPRAARRRGCVECGAELSEYLDAYYGRSSYARECCAKCRHRLSLT